MGTPIVFSVVWLTMSHNPWPITLTGNSVQGWGAVRHRSLKKEQISATTLTKWDRLRTEQT